MLSPATSPATIGRDGELEALRGAQAASRFGTPRGVMVAGEAGIGKTRLLADFVASLPDDVLVARGQCIAMGSIATPFAPLRGLLRDLAAQLGTPALLDAAGASARLLPSVLPELAEGPAAEISQDQLHEVVGTLLEGVSADRPVVAIVEDVHWADVPTLDLLRSLLHTLRRGQVLVVLSCRTDDVGRGHPLRPFLTELDRARDVGRIELGRLTADEAAEQVRTIRGELPAPEELAAVIERSDGIPFFIEELLALEDAAVALPTTLRELVLARYARLSPSTQAAVRLIAAGGVTVPHQLVTAVHGGESDAFDAAVREAIDAQMIGTDGASYTFRHSLTHEAVGDELLPGERVRLHTAYARALEQQGDRAGRWAEIAHHWLEALDQPRALAALVAASREARAAGAPQLEAQLGERALELWQHVPDAERVAAIERPRLSQAVALALLELGDPRAARVLEEALEQLAERDTLHRALLLHELMVVRHDSGIAQDFALARQALALLDEEHAEEDDESDEALAVRARVTSGIAVAEHFAGIDSRERTSRAIAFCRAALERLGDGEQATAVRLELARALTAQSSARAYAGDAEGGLAAFDEALATAGGDAVARLRHGEQVSWLLEHLGEHERAIDVAEGTLRFARPVGLARGWGAQISLMGARARLSVGDLEGADAVLRQVRAIRPPTVTLAYAAAVDAELRTMRDDAAGAASTLGEFAPTVAQLRTGDVDDDLGFAWIEALVALAERGPAAAWPEVEHGWRGRPRAGAAFPLLALGAEVLAALRTGGVDPPGTTAAEAEAALRAALDLVDVWPVAAEWRALIDAELSGPEGAGSDPAAWRQAADAAAHGRLPVRCRARALQRLAEAQLAAGDRDAAAATVAEATELVHRLGLVRAARQLGEFAARARLGAAGARTAPEGSALTARERQVLELVAGGLTNRQIGERLFISDKTASVHVSAILRKLGASGRAEAAARAAELLA